MFSNFLIGLREGLEASLVIGILVAYLVKAKESKGLGALWVGVGIAVAASLGVGALLTFTSHSLSFEAQEAFGGFMSIVAVAFVTWMVFWMRKAARSMRSELQDKLDSAFSAGPVAIAVTAFIAVAREGLETALFLWTNVQATGSTFEPILGGVLGLVTAVVLGWLIYKRAVNLDLRRFFLWTGGALIVVAAGVLSYGFHDLQEASIIPGLNSIAFDISSWYSPSSWYGTLLKGIFNLSATTTWVELTVWLAYVIPVMTLFLLPERPGTSTADHERSGPQPEGASRTRSRSRGDEDVMARPTTRSALAGSAMALVTLATISGCSTKASDAETIAVTATNSECQVAKTELESGTHTFRVTNKGSDVTEVYVYGANDRVMGEVENIGPGTSRDLKVDLAGGSFEVACKPGQKGTGIRTAISVSGEAAAPEAEPDRSVEVRAQGRKFTGLEDFTAQVGETVEFRLVNADDDDEHELELVSPDDESLGEVAPLQPGASGSVIITFEQGGTFSYLCDVENHKAEGMTGEFQTTADPSPATSSTDQP